MALKALLLKKKLDEKRSALNKLVEKDAEFVTREAELAKSISELTEENTLEEREVLEGAIAEWGGS